MMANQVEMIHPCIERPISFLCSLPESKRWCFLSIRYIGSNSLSPINHESVQYLVDFLDNSGDSHEVTELKLKDIRLSHPSDGGLQILRNFFSRSSNMRLTKVKLDGCNFGSQEDASQLLAAFQTNRTVTDLEILEIENLQGPSLGASLCGLLRNIPQLQKLACTCIYSDFMYGNGVRGFQPDLRANLNLKELHLQHCGLGDEGIHLIADGLVGNMTMEVLNIGSCNMLTSASLPNITRLLELTHLKKIYFNTQNIFSNTVATQHFAMKLDQNATVQELSWIHESFFPVYIRAATYASINNSLKRNRSLNQVGFLLAPLLPPPPSQQQPPAPSNNNDRTTTMLLKIWHEAIVKFANVPNNAGASAIFKLFQARPALLEKRLKRPAITASDVSQDTTTTPHDSICNSGGINNNSTNHGPSKRRRL